ncbi:hypothetical protein Tco_1196556 [Tanacetum coccineum]
MVEEMESLKENHTYELVELPNGKKALKNKQVYRLKMVELNSLERYKARYLSNPGKAHWEAAFTYSDMARDVDTRKSVSGYLVTFGGGAVSWQSRLQKCI